MPRVTGRLIDVEPLEEWEWELIRPHLAAHWQLFYDVLWETGCRAGEILQATKTDLQDGGIWVTREKRQDHRRDYIPLSPELYERLLAYSFYAHTRGMLFPYTWSGAHYILREASKKAGVRIVNGRSTIHPHLFRHGFGLRAISAALGAANPAEQLAIVSRMMGHKRISSTEIYTKATKASTERAFKILNQPAAPPAAAPAPGPGAAPARIPDGRHSDPQVAVDANLQAFGKNLRALLGLPVSPSLPK